MTTVRPAARAATVSSIQNEADGFFRVYFFGAPDGVRLVVGAATGDQWSRSMLTAIADCAQHVISSPRRRPALCLTCPTPLSVCPGMMFCVVVPEIANPRHAVGSALCPVCAMRSDLEQRAMVALREIWPDLREISVMPGSETVQ